MKGLIFALLGLSFFVSGAQAQESVHEVIKGQTSITPGHAAVVYTDRGAVFVNLMGNLPPEVKDTLGKILSSGEGIGIVVFCKVETIGGDGANRTGTILECQEPEPDKK